VGSASSNLLPVICLGSFEMMMFGLALRRVQMSEVPERGGPATMKGRRLGIGFLLSVMN